MNNEQPNESKPSKSEINWSLGSPWLRQRTSGPAVRRSLLARLLRALRCAV